MDIKVRTQSEISLIECTRKNIGLYGKKVNELNYIVANQGDKVEVLGMYKDEKEATEILNSIQIAIEEGFKHNKPGIIIQMP